MVPHKNLWVRILTRTLILLRKEFVLAWIRFTLLKHKLIGPISSVSDSASLRETQLSIVLVSSQVILMILGQELRTSALE